MYITHWKRSLQVSGILKLQFTTAICISLLFAFVSSLNLAVNPKLDPLQNDNQFYAMLAMNIAFGNGFSAIPRPDCGKADLSPEELFLLVKNNSQLAVATNERGPLGPTVLALFTRLSNFNLVKGMILFNFFGLLILGIFILFTCKQAGYSWRLGTIVLLLHFFILPRGYTTFYPILLVNIILVAVVMFSLRWINASRLTDVFYCGLSFGALILTRSHFLLLPFILLPAIKIIGRIPIKRIIMQTGVFMLPLLVFYFGWVLRNSVTLHEWTFEPRGVKHLFYRMYPDGIGSNPFVSPEIFVSHLESVTGPLPVSIKSGLQFKTDCTEENPPTVYSVPRELHGPLMKASLLLPLRHPDNYIAEEFRRLHVYLNNQNPAYKPSEPLFSNSKVQFVALSTKTLFLVKLFCFPLHWYNLIFIILCPVWITAWACTGREKILLLLCTILAFYNTLVLTGLSDAGSGYMSFSWVMVLIVVAWGYGVTGRKTFYLIQRTLRAISNHFIKYLHIYSERVINKH